MKQGKLKAEKTTAGFITTESWLEDFFHSKANKENAKEK